MERVMMKPGIDPWLVLRTRSRHENTVETDLNERHITAYLPRRNEIRRFKDRKIVVRTPLFPGYVFVQPRVDQYEKIRCIRGSCGLVLSGSTPAAMPERDLEAVRILVRSGAALVVTPRLVPGQRVEVRAGPFMGIRGELIRVKSQERLVINARLLSSSVSVEVDARSVEAL
jgi:transcription antitermination factor NusG